MNILSFSRLARAGLRCTIPLAATIALAACVTPPPRTIAVATPPPRKVFVYPANGQSPEQTDRDRYECHVWAVQQTGVDPSRSDANPYERVVVQPAKPAGIRDRGGRYRRRHSGRHHRGGPAMPARGLVIGGATGRPRWYGCGCQRSATGSNDPAADQSSSGTGACAGGFLYTGFGCLSAGTGLHHQLAAPLSVTRASMRYTSWES